jgi:PAS domain S-box-containing protein
MGKVETILGSSSVRENVTVALACFVTGWLGLELAITPGNASAIWPPSGIALAAVLLCGNRVWPGILIGSILVHAFIGFDSRTAQALLLSLCIPVLIGGGATLQAIGGGWLVKRFAGFPNPLRTVPQIAGLLTMGGVVGCLINASISVATLVLSGRLPLEGAPLTWLTWWSGDAIGVFVFTPMVLALLMRPRGEWKHRSRVIILSTAGSLVLGVALVAYTSHLERRDFEAKFADTGKDIGVSLEGTLAARLHAVGALQAFLSQAEDLSPETFSRFSANLRVHIPGVLALEWIPRVPLDQRAKFEIQARRQGYANFFISEFTAQGLSRAAARPEYFPVTFVEPYGANKRALGFDIGSDNLRQTAMVQARDSGGIAVTGRVELFQGGGNAVLALASVHRDAVGTGLRQDWDQLAGFALGVLSLNELAETTFRERDLAEIHYWLVDETVPERPVLLFSNTIDPPSSFSLTDRGLFGGSVTLGFARPFDIGGRHWVLRMAPTPLFIARHRLQNAWFVLVGGLLVTSLVAAFAMVVTGREGELHSLVDERTRTLRDALDQQKAVEAKLHTVSARLAREAARYQFLLKTASDGIHVLDEDGNLIEASDTFRHMLGYTAEQMLDLNVGDWSSLGNSSQIRERISTVMAEPAIFETQHRRSDGSRFDVEINCRGVEIEGKRYLYASSRDISERKREEAASRDKDHILSESQRIAHVGSWDYELAGQLTWSQETYRIYRVSPDSFIPNVENLMSLIQPDDRQAMRDWLACLSSGEKPGTLEFCINTLDGATRVLSGSGELQYDADHRPSRLVGIVHDITDRHKFEKDLQQSNAELEQFAYVASHDLRQPLRMITSYMTLIERRLKGTLDEETQEFMAFASGGAKKMDRLILDLLEYSRIGRQETPMEPVALADVVNEALQILGVAISDAAAVVTVPPLLPTVSGHYSDLVRLFQNLIGNAVKYHASERAPVVSVTVLRDAKTWTVSIQDNGIGIPLDQADRAFGVFQRLQTTEEYEGTGIGLAVCRKIVEQHGGRIWIAPVAGIGCDLRFTLPVKGERDVIG